MKGPTLQVTFPRYNGFGEKVMDAQIHLHTSFLIRNMRDTVSQITQYSDLKLINPFTFSVQAARQRGDDGPARGRGGRGLGRGQLKSRDEDDDDNDVLRIINPERTTPKTRPRPLPLIKGPKNKPSMLSHFAKQIKTAAISPKIKNDMSPMMKVNEIKLSNFKQVNTVVHYSRYNKHDFSYGECKKD